MTERKNVYFLKGYRGPQEENFLRSVRNTAVAFIVGFLTAVIVMISLLISFVGFMVASLLLLCALSAILMIAVVARLLE